MLVSAWDGTASLWNLETGQREGSFPSDSITSPLAEFSANNDFVVAYEGWASVWPSDVASWADYVCEAAGRDFNLMSGIKISYVLDSHTKTSVGPHRASKAECEREDTNSHGLSSPDPR